MKLSPIRPVLNALRTIPLVVTFVGYKTITEPYSFAVKFFEWLRIRGVCPERVRPLVNAEGPQDCTHLERLLEQGELERFLRAWAQSSRRTKLRHLGLKVGVLHKRQLLSMKPPVERGLGQSVRSGVPRVLMLATNSVPYTASGATQRTQSVAGALTGKGVSVEVMTRFAYPAIIGKFTAEKRERHEGIVYHRILPLVYPMSPRRRVDLAVKEVVKKAQELKANVLIATTDYKNAIVASRAAQKLGIPWVYEVRGEQEKSWVAKKPQSEQARAEKAEQFLKTRALETMYSAAASSVVALSQVSAEQLVSRGVDANRIFVIRNSVEEDLIAKKFNRATLRADLGLPEGPLLGTISSIVAYEGLELLVDMAALDPSLSVVIVGEGVSRPALIEYAQKKGVAERVFFPGKIPRERVWSWYAALDAFVMPRHDWAVCRTVTPLKTLAAMALRVPVIASDLPAIREITNGNALLIPNRDPRQYLKAFYWLRESTVERGKLLEAALSWARENTWRTNADKYISLFERLGLGS